MQLASIVISLFLLCPGVQSSQDKLRQHYESAEALSRAGNLDGAEAEYKSILTEAYRRLGRIYSAKQDHRGAIQAIESAIFYEPDSDEVLIDSAVVYFEAGQHQKALVQLQKVLARSPKSAVARHMLGKTYFMLRELEKAVNELEAALKLAPDDFDVAYTLGLVYLTQRQQASAGQLYEGTIKRLGDRAALHILFGRAYRETGFLPEAIAEFKKALILDPRCPRGHYYLGLTYLLSDGASKLSEAVDEFKSELAANPDEFLASYYLGIVYIYERKWELAATALESAARIQPNNPDSYFHLGQAYQGLEKHDRAIDVLRKAISLNPRLEHNDYQVTTAHYRLGQSLIKVGQVEAGQKELRLSADLKAEAFKKLNEYYAAGNARERNSRFSEAATVVKVGGEVNSLDETTRVILKNGESYYMKVIAGAYNSIGLLLTERQEFRAAAERFKEAARWNPDQEGLNYNLGLAYFKAELYKEAVPPLEAELKAHPQNNAARQLLELSHKRLEEKNRSQTRRED